MSEPFIIDAGILAGGLGRRMQGKDKGLQLFHKKPMVEWVYQAVSPYVRNVVINCNRNHSAYLKISKTLTSDTIKGFPGPLAGIVSIIQASDADYFLISPCDTPMLSSLFAKRMINTLKIKLENQDKASVLLAVTTGEKQQPLHLCIGRDYLASLQDYLDRGEHRVMQWMKDNQVEWVDFSDSVTIFRNLNTLSEVSAY